MADERNNEQKEEQWFSNKDIYLMVQDLTIELQETREAVKSYNGLRQDLNWCMQQIQSNIGMSTGREIVWAAIRDWGGWFVAIGMLAYHLFGGR